MGSCTRTTFYTVNSSYTAKSESLRKKFQMAWSNVVQTTFQSLPLASRQLTIMRLVRILAQTKILLAVTKQNRNCFFQKLKGLESRDVAKF